MPLTTWPSVYGCYSRASRAKGHVACAGRLAARDRIGNRARHRWPRQNQRCCCRGSPSRSVAEGGTHGPTRFAVTCDEFADSQVAMVLMEETT